MPQLKLIKIANLQPTQEKLNLAIVNHYSSETYQWKLPEIWKNNNIYYIADGHHRIFSKYFQNLNKEIKIPIKLYTKYNLKVSQQAYEYIIDEILSNGEKMIKKRITHISHLKLI